MCSTQSGHPGWIEREGGETRTGDYGYGLRRRQDRTKRPIMGEEAARLSDWVIATSTTSERGPAVDIE
ncbi:MAG: hypothetical protein IPM55_16470 [Acidobacteria bacterium]|nr:hypothetical protein [Acidobacteriota bacterium]